MNANLCLVVTNLASYFWVLSSKLPLLLEKIGTYAHLCPLDEVKLVFLLQYVGANLSYVEHLIVIDI